MCKFVNLILILIPYRIYYFLRIRQSRNYKINRGAVRKFLFVWNKKHAERILYWRCRCKFRGRGLDLGNSMYSLFKYLCSCHISDDLALFLKYVFPILSIIAFFHHLVCVLHDFVYTLINGFHLYTHSIYSTRYLVKSPMSMFSTVSTESRSS